MLRTLAPLPCCGCSVLLLRCQAVWSPPLLTACVCDLCRVRVLVRLSHPRPPDRNQHGCTVRVLPGPTRVLPMPRQYGIGRRAPTRAVLSCAASWCLVVRRPRRCVDCLVLTFCYVSSRSSTKKFHKKSSTKKVPLPKKVPTQRKSSKKKAPNKNSPKKIHQIKKRPKKKFPQKNFKKKFKKKVRKNPPKKKKVQKKFQKPQKFKTAIQSKN